MASQIQRSMRSNHDPLFPPANNEPVRKKAGRRGRRSDAELLAELERQLADEKAQLEREAAELKKRTEINPAVKKIPSLAKHLLAYAQFAVDNGRLDLSNMVAMFLAGLQRIHDTEITAAEDALQELSGNGSEEGETEAPELDDDFRRERW
jgi:hypothetical protein